MAKSEEKKPVNPTEEFVKGYRALVEKWGFEIVAVPEYRLRDDGTFSLILTSRVSKVKKAA